MIEKSKISLGTHKWLILSHAFNMDGRAASSTVTDKIPYILEAGIEIQVISAITGKKDYRFPHHQVLPWGPSGLRFDFRHWCELKVGRGIKYKLITSTISILLSPFIFIEKLLFGFSNQASWSLAAAFKGWQLIRSGQIDLVYSSGGAWSAHYAAWLLKKFTKIKWVAEIHDPMVHRDPSHGDQTKDRNKKFLKKLESLICNDADFVWWFTEGALQQARLRNPTLGNRGFYVLAGAQPPNQPSNHTYKNQLHICHFGSMAEDRSLQPLLEAISKLIKRQPSIANYLQIDMYGSPLDTTSIEAINNLKLENIVQIHGRLKADASKNISSRDLAFIKMSEADVLLLLHGSSPYCEEYIPSKWYDYLHAARPVLALTHNNKSFNIELEKRNSYVAPTNDSEAISKLVENIFLDWQQKKLRAPHEKPIQASETFKIILEKVCH